MNESKIKEIVRQIVRESFQQSLSEETYQFGKKSYTDKKLTPSEILDLANAYINTPITKISGSSLGSRVYTANDLARLTGTIQMDVKTRSKQPALIVQILKNGLLTKDEYVKLYTALIKLQAKFIESYLKNASPEKRNSSAAMRAAARDGKDDFNFENVNEMSQNDVHFKDILRMYDHGGSFSKKKVAVVVCKNPRASRKDIIDAMLDMDYNEITDVQDELGIKESVQGDKIQNLNNRIKVLRDKISATKSQEQKNKFQNTLKNALQSLSNIRKGQNESVNENVIAKDGKVLSNNNLIGYYEFDRDADSFWVDDVKKGKGQLSFDTKKEVEDYFKKNEKDALKHLGKLRGESINEAKYDTYHKTYTSAIQAGLDWAKKSGYDYDEEEAAREIGMGPRKPSEGKTNKFHLSLRKDFKPQKKMLHIQVYGMKNSYELNAYIG